MVTQGVDLTLEVASGIGGSSADLGKDMCSVDFNGDGAEDLLIGAPGEDRAYLFLGPTTDLSPGNADVVFQGSANSNFGFSVTNAGPINADIYEDIAIGAPLDDKAFVFTGGPSPTGTVTLSNAAVNISGTANSKFGWDVAGILDFSDDSEIDLAVSAPEATNRSLINAGSVAIYTNIITDLGTTISTPDFEFLGNDTEERLGWSISTAGDFNGDNVPDLLMGAPGNNSNEGAVYIALGSTFPYLNFVENMSVEQLNLKIYANFGTPGTCRLGESVCYGGELGGDPKSDIVLGAPGYNDNQGVVYLVFGGSFTGMLNLSLTTASYTIQGNSTGDQFGSSVSYGGDLDGMGDDDIIIGSPYNDNNGSVYGIYGPFLSTTLPVKVSNVMGFKITGETNFGLFGRAVSFGGINNGDHYSTLLCSEAGSGDGAVYLYEVDKSPVLSDLLFDPDEGVADTLFSINITYSDAEGDAPEYVNLHIYNDPACNNEMAGSPLTMTGAGNYLTGVNFTVSTVLPHPGAYFIVETKALTGATNIISSAIVQGPIVDGVIPGKVNDLSGNINFTGVQDGEIRLDWTFPGDDDFIGFVEEAWLVYNGSVIDESNFNSSIVLETWDSINLPPTGGTPASFLVEDIVGLTPGSTYYFALRAVDDLGQYSNISNVLVASTYETIIINDAGPDPITGVQAIDVPNDNGGSINVSWTETTATDFAYYHIYGSQTVFTNIDGMEPIANITENISWKEVSKDSTGADLLNGRDYYFAVVAFDIDNLFDANVTTAGPVKPIDNNAQIPPIIKGVELIDTPADNGKNLTVTWTKTTASDFKCYNIYIDNKVITKLDNLEPSKCIYSINTELAYLTKISGNDLQEGTYYYVAVTTLTWNGLENTDINNNNTAGPATPIDNLDTTIPNQISNLRAMDQSDDDGGALYLSWNVPNNLAFGNYNIYISTTKIKSIDTLEPEIRIYEKLVNEYVITTIDGNSLQDGIDYYVAITVVSWNNIENTFIDTEAKGNSFGPVQSVDNNDGSPPPLIEGVGLEGTTVDSITIKWTPFTLVILVDFNAYVITFWSMDNPSDKVVKEISEIETSEYIAKGLVDGTKYTFEVRCRDDAGNLGEAVTLEITAGGENQAPVINEFKLVTTQDFKAFFSIDVVDARTPKAELTVEWDFNNDGITDKTGTGADTQKEHTYPEEGDYTCRITVSDGELSVSKTVKVNITAPKTTTDDDEISTTAKVGIGLGIAVFVIIVIVMIVLVLVFINRKKKIDQQIEAERKPVYNYHTLVVEEKSSDRCPSCGAHLSLDEHTVFCPICGAKVKEEDLDDDIKRIHEEQARQKEEERKKAAEEMERLAKGEAKPEGMVEDESLPQDDDGIPDVQLPDSDSPLTDEDLPPDLAGPEEPEEDLPQMEPVETIMED